MNTKTMRLPPRRVLTEKRKERDGFISSITEAAPGNAVTNSTPETNSISKEFTVAAAESVGSNQLMLACYMSYEFLTNGTLLGEQLNPAGPQIDPSSAQSLDSRKVKPSHIIEASEENEPKRKRYVEVANLLRADEAHFPGIVNPAQLARFLKL